MQIRLSKSFDYIAHLSSSTTPTTDNNKKTRLHDPPVMTTANSEDVESAGNRREGMIKELMDHLQSGGSSADTIEKTSSHDTGELLKRPQPPRSRSLPLHHKNLVQPEIRLIHP